MPPILVRTPQFLVIDKPAGLPVHSGRAGGPSVEDFFPAWRVGKAGPWLAHRLDRDTAGCLVIALKKSALLAAQARFAAGDVAKTYWAIVAGDPPAAGTISQPLAKRTTGRAWKMVADDKAAPAVTGFIVRARAPQRAWVEFTPLTGRTHQIRAHAAYLGCPVLGDAVYGGGGGPLMLLARAIAMPLDPPLGATAPPPGPMRALLAALFHAAF